MFTCRVDINVQETLKSYYKNTMNVSTFQLDVYARYLGCLRDTLAPGRALVASGPFRRPLPLFAVTGTFLHRRQ